MIAALFLGSYDALARSVKSSNSQQPQSLTKAANRTETYTDIIEKAYNLSLQKDRAQAILLLVGSIKKESKKGPKANKDLLRALDQVSNAFYSDKTQQLYELGISIRLSDPNLAQQKITEALKLEPDNLSVQLAQIRLQMILGDCRGALNGGKGIKEIIPFSEEVDLVISQAAVCSGEFEFYQQIKAASDDKRSTMARHWNVVEMEYLFKNGQFQKGIEISQVRQKAEPTFPEPFYWQWKMELELKTLQDATATKYLKLCKAISARDLRDFLAEPFLCRRTTEVETFLKKNNNPNL